MALYQDPSNSFMNYYQGQHPDEYTMSGEPVSQPTSEVDRLLKAVMASMEEPPEEGMAQPPQAPFNPMQGGWKGALNTMAAPYNQYQRPLIQPTLEYQQKTALEYPQKAAEARVTAQGTRQKNLVGALNAASLMEQRQAQAQKWQMGGPGQQINRGNVRTLYDQEDPSSPTGVSDITYQLVPKGDGSVSMIEIGRNNKSVTSKTVTGSSPGQPPQIYQWNPKSGKIETINGGMYPPPSQLEEKDYRRQQVNRQALGDIWNEYTKMYSKISKEPDFLNIRKKASTFASRIDFLRDFADPVYVNYTRTIDASLNAYVLSVTGQAFAETAFRRYRNQYPMPWDTPEEAKHALQALANMVNRDIDAAIARNPSLSKPGAQSFDWNPSLGQGEDITDPDRYAVP